MTTPLMVGSIEVHLLRDGTDRVPPGMILAGAPDDLAAVRGQLDPDGLLPVAYNGLLVRAAGRVVLVDAGLGELSELEGAGGELPSALAALGVRPDDIDEVVISHGHSDHIAGLTRTEDERQVPRYARARHWFWRAEWAYWTSEHSLAGMAPNLAEPARQSLPPLREAGLVTHVDREQEIAAGVRIMPAAGHTPGHVAVVIESEGERAIYLGDAVFHPLNFELSDWTCVFDVDGVAATRSRRCQLDMADRDGSLVLAAHLAGAGRVERGGAGYRFLPEP